jgi:hypothetical protein
MKGDEWRMCRRAPILLVDSCLSFFKKIKK